MGCVRVGYSWLCLMRGYLYAWMRIKVAELSSWSAGTLMVNPSCSKSFPILLLKKGMYIVKQTIMPISLCIMHTHAHMVGVSPGDVELSLHTTIPRSQIKYCPYFQIFQEVE